MSLHCRHSHLGHHEQHNRKKTFHGSGRVLWSRSRAQLCSPLARAAKPRNMAPRLALNPIATGSSKSSCFTPPVLQSNVRQCVACRASSSGNTDAAYAAARAVASTSSLVGVVALACSATTVSCCTVEHVLTIHAHVNTQTNRIRPGDHHRPRPPCRCRPLSPRHCSRLCRRRPAGDPGCLAPV